MQYCIQQNMQLSSVLYASLYSISFVVACYISCNCMQDCLTFEQNIAYFKQTRQFVQHQLIFKFPKTLIVWRIRPNVIACILTRNQWDFDQFNHRRLNSNSPARLSFLNSNRMNTSQQQQLIDTSSKKRSVCTQELVGRFNSKFDFLKYFKE